MHLSISIVKNKKLNSARKASVKSSKIKGATTFIYVLM